MGFDMKPTKTEEERRCSTLYGVNNKTACLIEKALEAYDRNFGKIEVG